MDTEKRRVGRPRVRNFVTKEFLKEVKELETLADEVEGHVIVANQMAILPHWRLECLIQKANAVRFHDCVVEI